MSTFDEFMINKAVEDDEKQSKLLSELTTLRQRCAEHSQLRTILNASPDESLVQAAQRVMLLLADRHEWQQVAQSNCEKLDTSRREVEELRAQLAEAQQINASLHNSATEHHKYCSDIAVERDQLRQSLLASEAAREKMRTCASHIASILADKRNADDSTIHAGNTAFISMERWANEILSTPFSTLLAEHDASLVKPLVEALEPFAKAADEVRGIPANDDIVYGDWPCTVGDLRAARAAIRRELDGV